MGPRAASSAGHERTRAPDATEVVDLRDPFDQLGVDGEERSSRGHSGVVDEEVDRGVSLEHARGERVDRDAIADVAEPPTRSRTRPRARSSRSIPAGDQHAVPTPFGEQPRRRLPDPGRRSGDDGDALIADVLMRWSTTL